jgi:outer membrane protein assembly factor BamB
MHRTRSWPSPWSLLLLLLLRGPAWADWPAFRGPQGNGTSAERGLPAKWDGAANLLWKTKLPGPGASTPIVWGDRVFVTCYSGYGDGPDTRTGPDQLRRRLLCLERQTGRVLWDRAVAAKLPESEYAGQIRQHGYATSTPVTDGQRVYVFFNRTGVLAFDFAGKELWHTELGKGLNGWGSASSPTLFGNLLLVNATVECRALVALDRASGKEVWRAKVDGDSWSTPVVVELPGGKHEVVLSGHGALFGFDPGTGKELWQCETTVGTTAGSSPVVRGDIVYVMGGGFNDRLFLAVRAGGRGDVTQTHVVWKQTKVGASNCSPVLACDHLIFFSGQATCLRADTGEVVYQERLAGLGAEYASPVVVADGKLFLFTRRGAGHVLAAGPRFEELGRIDLAGTTGFTASPAVSHGQLFVRDREHLYCLGEKKGAIPPGGR